LNKEPWEIEATGYENGINPFMGTFQRKFNIKPVPYGNKAKADFITNVQKNIKDIKYYFWGEIKLTIRLYLNESRRYETSESADLDNYAKLICDSLKGVNGIIIDDSQIQTLTIQWIDTMKDEHFEIEISSFPDEFILKDIDLYEMPNGLFYPFSKYCWSKEGIKQVDIKPLLKVVYEYTKIQKPFKHKLRQLGKNKEEAYFDSQKIHPVLRGFHKNRVIESGFNLLYLEYWEKEIF
jgi:Holliday junction resolvase RusA-like endonuclease